MSKPQNNQLCYVWFADAGLTPWQGIWQSMYQRWHFPQTNGSAFLADASAWAPVPHAQAADELRALLEKALLELEFAGLNVPLCKTISDTLTSLHRQSVEHGMGVHTP